jgi:amino acid permease
MMYPLLQKELKEIKAVSVILFISIGLFVVLMIVQLEFDGSNLNPDSSYSIYYKVKLDIQLMNGFGIILVAYGFSQNLFPIYASLENKMTSNALKATAMGLAMSLVLYLGMGILSLYVFGSGLYESVLTNIDEETTVSSYIIRSLFMIVLACHIPYNFFSGKESVLIMIDEHKRNSMSNALELTL